jgi:hypothetical protein
MKSKSEVGKRYFNLTVLEETNKRTKAREKIFRVRCNCGTEKEIALTHVRRGSIKSCGCLKVGKFKEFIKGNVWDNHVGFKGCGGMLGSVWGRILASAKKRNIKVEISIEEAWGLFEKQNGKCALSGETITFAKNCKELKLGLNTASLDRIDSSLGYVKDNVQWVHVKVNYMKQQFKQIDFLDWCRKISNYQIDKYKKV